MPFQTERTEGFPIMSADSVVRLRVTALGLDERTQIQVRQLLHRAQADHYVLVEGEGDVALINLDGPDGLRMWQSCHQLAPNKPILALSSHTPSLPGTWLLPVPVEIDTLLAVLDTLYQSLSTGAPPQPGATRGGLHASSRSGSRGTVSAPQSPRHLQGIDLDDPRQVAELYFTPTDYLGGQIQQRIREAMQARVICEILCGSGKMILLPETGMVMTDLSDGRLKQYSLMRYPTGTAGVPFEFKSRLMPFNTEVRLIQQMQGGPETRQVRPDTLLWKLGAWTSRGRAPVGTDLTQPIVFLRWPNLTRLMLTPNALRIAAVCCAQQPRSLAATANALNVPISHVLTFYSACVAVDLVTLPKRQADFLLQPEPIRDHGQRSLMQRWISRLTGN